MYEIRTEIEISASPERVWSILLDFPGHSEWNPFIRSITGSPKPRERLKAFIQPRGGKGMIFRPKVLVAASNRELRWLGHFMLPGIFDGEHYFQIIPITPNRIRFVHGEKFSGVLVAIARAGLEGGTRAGFVAMNQALKARAERVNPADVPVNRSP
jgi:hypothetical protein